MEAKSQQSNYRIIHRSEDLIKTFSFLHKFQKFTLQARDMGNNIKRIIKESRKENMGQQDTREPIQARDKDSL